MVELIGLLTISAGETFTQALPWEIGNALIAGIRRHRLTNAAVQEAWAS